ncbi:universal stress protein [Trichocoleus desertorum AS-A10]|uniref:universal stress protein n=1 Tax=Trichocoleus desertorum TaxID=1481672 RepID=UPI0032997F55
MPSTTSPLLPPLLLATDGSTSAGTAQRLVLPVIQLFSQLPPEADRQTWLDVLTVQPRPAGMRPRLPALSRKPTAETRTPEAEPELTSPLSLPEVENGHRADLNPNDLFAQIKAEMPLDRKIAYQSREGRPATEILNHARTIQAGLIAVGHRGVGGSRELLLGSVSSAIARYATCHVLVARGLPEAPTLQPKWHHVLLAVNGSQATKQAIALTRQLIPAGIQRVTILCAQTPLNPHYLFGPFATPTPNWQLTQSLQQAQKEQSEQIIQKAQEKLAGANVAITSLIQTGEPGPIICQIAQQQQADVIILGSDRHPAFRNIRLTATGDYVLHHAPCPILLCRTARSETETNLGSEAEISREEA